MNFSIFEGYVEEILYCWISEVGLFKFIYFKLYKKEKENKYFLIEYIIMGRVYVYIGFLEI